MPEYVQVFNYKQNLQTVCPPPVYILCPFSKQHKNYRSTVINVSWGRCRGQNQTKLTVVCSISIILHLNTLTEYFTHPNGTSSVQYLQCYIIFYYIFSKTTDNYTLSYEEMVISSSSKSSSKLFLFGCVVGFAGGWLFTRVGFIFADQTGVTYYEMSVTWIQERRTFMPVSCNQFDTKINIMYN